MTNVSNLAHKVHRKYLTFLHLNPLAIKIELNMNYSSSRYTIDEIKEITELLLNTFAGLEPNVRVSKYIKIRTSRIRFVVIITLYRGHQYSV